MSKTRPPGWVPSGTPLGVGQLRDATFNTRRGKEARNGGAELTVTVLVCGTRVMYGRHEWELAPVMGDGSLWVQDNGPVVERMLTATEEVTLKLSDTESVTVTRPVAVSSKEKEQ